MRVTRVVATSRAVARERAVRDALQTLDTDGACQVRIETSDGVAGRSVIGFGRVAAAPEVLAGLINLELGPAVVGEDPALVRSIRDRLWRLTDYHGSTGLALLGIAAIDIALWDVLGRSLGQPVWRLLGGARDRVPAYAMVGWLDYSPDELAEQCRRAMSQGFRGVKVKVGAPTLDEDLRRLGVVREAIGERALLMVDANQVFSVKEALRRGRAYEELGCYWFEEPVPADDEEGLALLARTLTIPIAAGENLYGRRQFRRLLEKRAFDIVQPDLRRAGGLTECLEVGLMADAFGVAYASHGGGAHLHVLGALSNALFLESGLLAEGERLVDGCRMLPQDPGIGSLRG